MSLIYVKFSFTFPQVHNPTGPAVVSEDDDGFCGSDEGPSEGKIVARLWRHAGNQESRALLTK